MTDAQARELVLGNWHKFNAFLQSHPRLGDLRRLMALELSRGKEARPNFLERLRSAIASHGSRDSKEALDNIIIAFEHGHMPDFEDVERVLGYVGIGVTPPEASAVLNELQRTLK